MDRFELHNATRSPYFPSPAERRRWGSSKALVVAKKLRQMVSWSTCPQLTFLDGPIQQFGDAPFRDATVVVSAVDSNATRVYIGSMARKHGRPLVEAGFRGSDTHYAVISNDRDGACWLCHQQVKTVDHLRFSCSDHAREVEEAGFVPATQPAAATLGGLMGEAVVQLGHHNRDVTNRRHFVNVTTVKTATVRLTLDEHCQGRHAWPEVAFQVNVDGASPAAELLARLSERLECPSVILPHRYVISTPCAQCLNSLEINRPEWALLSRPHCKRCGGPWDLRNAKAHQASFPVEVHTVLSEDTPELFGLSLDTIGIVPGTLLEVTDGGGGTRLVDVSGSSIH
jgi:molybdopterin/thiamine biosynthesis adenylyltransferase